MRAAVKMGTAAVPARLYVREGLLEQGTEGIALDAEQSGVRDLREVLGLGGADLGVGGDDIELGGADVGSALEQYRREAGRDDGGKRLGGLVEGPAPDDVAGVLTQEEAQKIAAPRATITNRIGMSRKCVKVGICSPLAAASAGVIVPSANASALRRRGRMK